MTDAPRPDDETRRPANPADAEQPPSATQPARSARGGEAASEPPRLADPTVAPTIDDDASAGGDESAVGGEPTSTAAASPTEANADDALDAAAERVEADLALLRAERDEFLDAYRRAQADFENYRKQAYRRQEDAVQRALGGFVEGLLPVLDACDAAVAHGAGEAVEPVVAALFGALEKEGLERIEPVGEPFDPAEAEAVIHEPGDGGEQVVAEVMRAGYRWRGQVLRPAMVKVTD